MIEKNKTDLLYTYKRKTETESGILRFSFECNLNDEIIEADLADMIIYVCQRDLRLQKLLQKINNCSVDDLLAIANMYRKILLSDKV